MRGKVYILVLLMMGSTVPASGIMVRYTDESGKIHYADTDYSRIPERYMDQVRPQIEAAERERKQKEEQEKPKGIPDAAEPEVSVALPPVPPTVKVYVGSDCLDCQDLILALATGGVPIEPINVDTDPQGREFYTEQGGDLPITTIGNTIVRGNNPEQIISTYRQEKDRAGNNTPPLDDPDDQGEAEQRGPIRYER